MKRSQLDKVDVARHLLPDPGPQVVGDLVEELRKFPGMDIQHKEDGCWLCFEASNGCQAALNLTEEAQFSGPVVRKALLQWIEDTRPKK